MYRILIVEDEELLRNELTLCMDWADMSFCPPELARDGSQGLAMALTRPPDVVLTDVRMPRMDGLSMIREMCKSLRCLYIVLSGYDDFSYAVEALHYGVMDYLLKPVDERQLETVLRGAAARLAPE